MYTSIQTACAWPGATFSGNPPRPSRAFSGTSCTGCQPTVCFGAAGLPGSQAHDACVSSVTFIERTEKSWIGRPAESDGSPAGGA